MSELETVEYEGKVYQLNTLYQMKCGTKVVLDGLSSRGKLHVSMLDSGSVETVDYFVDELFETSIVCGTITDAPLKLEDGEWYMCETSTKELVCFHRENGNWLCGKGGKVGMKDGSVKPLYKMVRA